MAAALYALFAVLALLLASVAAADEGVVEERGEGGYTRADAVRDAFKWLDNGNRSPVTGEPCISKAMVETERNRCLKTWEKIGLGVTKLLGIVLTESVDDIMRHCDADRDDCISEKDFRRTAGTCLNSPEKLEALRSHLFARKESGEC